VGELAVGQVITVILSPQEGAGLAPAVLMQRSNTKPDYPGCMDAFGLACYVQNKIAA
jgi:hypothetical protein